MLQSLVLSMKGRNFLNTCRFIPIFRKFEQVVTDIRKVPHWTAHFFPPIFPLSSSRNLKNLGTKMGVYIFLQICFLFCFHPLVSNHDDDSWWHFEQRLSAHIGCSIDWQSWAHMDRGPEKYWRCHHGASSDKCTDTIRTYSCTRGYKNICSLSP